MEKLHTLFRSRLPDVIGNIKKNIVSEVEPSSRVNLREHAYRQK